VVETPAPLESRDYGDPVVVASMAQVKPLTLEFGLELMPLTEPDLGGTLMEKVNRLRLSLVTDTGFILPGVHFQDQPKLPPNTYLILVRGNVVARGAVVPGHELALLEGVTDGSSLEGFAVTDPVTGRMAAWVQGEAVQDALEQGCTVLTADRAVMRHLESVVRGHAWELLRIEDVDMMLGQLGEQAPALIRLLGTTPLTMLDVHAVLVRLLREHVPIRDLELVVEALVERSRTTTDTTRLVEAARGRLTRALCSAIADSHQLIRVLHLDDRLDVLITTSGPLEDEDGVPQMPDWQPELVAALMEAVNEAGAERPVAVICSKSARPLVRPLLGATLPELAVLAPHEVAPGFTVLEVGVVHVPTEVTLDWVDPPPEGF
jgi:flagellar biosynthesis protein FlhA